MSDLDEINGYWVWVVKYGNYEPAEVDSIWATEEQADARVEELAGGMWEVSPMWVQS